MSNWRKINNKRDIQNKYKIYGGGLCKECSFIGDVTNKNLEFLNIDDPEIHFDKIKIIDKVDLLDSKTAKTRKDIRFWFDDGTRYLLNFGIRNRICWIDDDTDIMKVSWKISSTSKEDVTIIKDNILGWYVSFYIPGIESLRLEKLNHV